MSQPQPQYRIVASDLDGTLLASDLSLSRENDAAISALSQRGVQLVPASGRTFSELAPEVLHHPAVRYLIHSDGAVIYDKQTQTRYTACMTPEQTAGALRIFAAHDAILTVRYGGRCYVNAATHNDADYIAHRVNRYYREFYYRTSIPVEDFDTFCLGMEACEMISGFFPSDAQLHACAEQLAALEGISVTSADSGNVEIHSREAGKGAALIRLAKLLDVPIEQTVAVGDSDNDASMIRAAGLGLAVANAFDSLKRDADAVICSNDGHVIDYILKHYIQ